MTALRVRLWFWQLITWLSYFSQVVFLQNKELVFSSVGEFLHDHGHVFAWPSPFSRPIFHDPSLFCSLKKLWPSLCSHPPPLLLIFDKSLTSFGRVVSASNSQSGRSGFESRSGDFGFVLCRPELKSSATLVNSQLVAFCQLALLILLCCIWIICF